MKYHVRVVHESRVEEVYEIEATSPEEAKELLEEGYPDDCGEFISSKDVGGEILDVDVQEAVLCEVCLARGVETAATIRAVRGPEEHHLCAKHSREEVFHEGSH